MTQIAARVLPPEIRAAQDEMEERARKYGLDFFPTIFEVVDYE
jgi:stage V sporulation protein R